MIALLVAHPQVYVDVAVIDWLLPRAVFYCDIVARAFSECRPSVADSPAITRCRCDPG